MSVNMRDILEAVVSHAAASGHFELVNKYEPKNAPGRGLVCSVWIDRVEPVRTSGLNSTSVRVALNLRIYTNMIQEPQDDIEEYVMTAVDDLMTAYTNDFSLDGLVRNVDLLGGHGVPLSAQAGYLEIDNKMFRVMTITLPVVVNDVWTQNA